MVAATWWQLPGGGRQCRDLSVKSSQSTSLIDPFCFRCVFLNVVWKVRPAYDVPKVFRKIRRNPIMTIGSEGSGVGTHQHDANFQSQVKKLSLLLVFT